MTEEEKHAQLMKAFARLQEHFKNIVILVEDDSNQFRMTTTGNAPYGMRKTYCMLFEELTKDDAHRMRKDVEDNESQ